MKVNCGHGQIGDGKSEQEHLRNHELKKGQEWMNLIQITIISTKGKNHLEDMVKPL